MKLLSNQINPHFTFPDSLHALVSMAWFGSSKDLDFKSEFRTSHYRLTNSARTALGIIADVVKPKKKIGIPAFICAVVATPFLDRGYEIEWIDTDKNGLIDPYDFQKKVKNIDLVMVPHIFGQEAPLEKVIAIAQTHNIFVVEDGAHLHTNTLTDTQKGPQPDVKILSFGREKVLSCVSGGALIWPEDSPYVDKFKGYHLAKPSFLWSLRHAIQPLIFNLGEFWWHYGGKAIPWLASKLKILPRAVSSAEKSGQEDFPMTPLPIPQQRILKRQYQQSNHRTQHAQQISKTWSEKLPARFPKAKIIIPKNYLRVIITGISKSETTKNSFPKLNITEWNGVPISPSGVDLSRFGYKPGQCPQAETYSQSYITLPTHIKIKPADLEKNL